MHGYTSIADMISRSTSNANQSCYNNIRRTKSTNSVRRCPSLHSVVDPVAAKKHALVAATVAYERAHGKENNHTQLEQQLSRQPHRRRSNRITGFEGEGSHFHGLKTPKRRSSNRHSDAEGNADHHPRSRRGTLSSQLCLNRMPSVHTMHEEERFKQHRSSISVHKLRKARSMCSSSHVQSSSINDIAFEPTVHVKMSPLPTTREEKIASNTELDIEDAVDITSSPPMPLTNINLQNLSGYPEGDVVRPGRDLRARSVRHCASMMLTPFKKRNFAVSSSTTLPAATTDVIPSYASIVRPPGPVAATTPRFQRKRAISEVIKMGSVAAKIRSVFRPTSNPIQELPVQQINASRAYFGSEFPCQAPLIESTEGKSQRTRDEDALSTLSLRPPPTRVHETGSSRSVLSIGVKSRVTSWADSTTAGTVIDANDEQYLNAITEEVHHREAVLGKNDNYMSLNIFRRMRRASKANMHSSEHSECRSKAGGSRQSRRTKSRAEQNTTRKTSGARETLPSQVVKATTLIKSSVRAVSPGADSQTTETSTNHPVLSNLLTQDTSSSDRSAHSTLNKRHKSQNVSPQPLVAPKPTTELIAGRVKRSDERWQEPLDGDRSLFYPRSPKQASPNRHSRQSSTYSDDKNETERSSDGVFQGIQETRLSHDVNMISPSIYSDGGGCVDLDNIHELSALPPTPLDPSPGTALILTSHHVAKYSVGSPKRSESSQNRKTSKDWRNWLRSEVQDLETPPSDDLHLNSEFIHRNPDSRHHEELAQVYDDAQDVQADGSTNDSGLQPVVVPCMAWRPNQPLRIIQHASEYSIPSTTTSVQSRHQVWSPFKEADAEDFAGGVGRSGDRRANSSQARKMSYLYGPEDRPSSRLHDIMEGSSVTSRPPSRMNDRFPYITSSRPQSRTSGRSSTPAQSLRSRSSRPTMVNWTQSTSGRHKENNVPSPTQSLPTRPSLPLALVRRPMSTAPLGRSQSSLVRYTKNAQNASPAASLPATPQSSLLPCSTHSSPQRPTSTRSHTASSNAIIGKLKHISMPSLETDPTLASIVQGPYRQRASIRPLSICKPTSYFEQDSPLKENSAPTTPTAEALAPPSSGHRLAEQFLNARRFREEMKVMSSAEGSPINATDLSEFSPAFL